MPPNMKKKWWTPALAWSAAALLVFFLAGGVIPHLAGKVDHPLLSALSQHARYLYWACGLMVMVGWVDSALLYRRQRFHQE